MGDVTELDTKRADQIIDDVLEEGDHDKFAHYVDKDELMEAMLAGTPLFALCGKLWVPTRDGLKFPKCPLCVEAWENLPHD